MLKSIFSNSGQLFKDIQSCEKEMETDADMAEKEGLTIPISWRFRNFFKHADHCYSAPAAVSESYGMTFSTI